jgi:hypothetical protein
VNIVLAWSIFSAEQEKTQSMVFIFILLLLLLLLFFFFAECSLFAECESSCNRAVAAAENLPHRHIR